MEAERARELLAAERREIEHTLRHHVHEDDGEDAGWQEPANVAASLYLDELDEALADERASRGFADRGTDGRGRARVGRARSSLTGFFLDLTPLQSLR